MSSGNGETPQFQTEDVQRDPGPTSELEVYANAIDPTVDGDDDLLGTINLGLGNYSDREYWQQVQSFRAAMYGSDAFGRRLKHRRLREALYQEAEQKWANGEISGDDRRRAIWNYINGVMNNLDQETLERELEKRGVDERFTPPHWRMMQMRHEASRSKSARLLDNLFGRIKKSIKSIKSDGSAPVDQLRDRL